MMTVELLLSSEVGVLDPLKFPSSSPFVLFTRKKEKRKVVVM